MIEKSLGPANSSFRCDPYARLTDWKTAYSALSRFAYWPGFGPEGQNDLWFGSSQLSQYWMAFL